MDVSKLYGTGVALVTPFNENLEIDYNALEKLVEHVITGGVDYLVVMGTTGEASTLSPKEKQAVLEFVVAKNAGRLPIVYGIGGNSTIDVVERLEKQDYTGIDAILSVAPYYNKPSQEGYKYHYNQVADASKKPVIMYNVPGRTSGNMTAETTIELSKHPNIIAMKEASGDIVQCTKIAAATNDNFILISGDDMLTVPLISLGAKGVISVMANLVPDAFSRTINCALEENFKEASQIQYGLMEINDFLFAEGNPAGLKAGLKYIGLMEEYLRPPLLPISNELRGTVKSWAEKNYASA
ncbi:MAG: 4-hydroxy-tetrahydrodipicolinate synthase [Bacteroidota bacterium]